MAIKRWNGSTGNYATAANWVGGVAPVATDDVIIDGTSQHDIDGSNQSGTALESFTITPNYVGSIGSSGASLRITASTGTLRGSGDECWIDPAFTTSYLAPQVATPNACQFGGGGGIGIGLFIVAAGNIVIRSGTNWGDGMVVTNTGEGPTPAIKIESGQTFLAATQLHITAGRVTLEDSLDGADSIIVVSGGLAILDDSGTTTLVIVNGGTLQHDDGRITWAFVHGSGTWDASQSTVSRIVDAMHLTGPHAVGDWRNGSKSGFPTILQPFANPVILTDSPHQGF